MRYFNTHTLMLLSVLASSSVYAAQSVDLRDNSGSSLAVAGQALPLFQLATTRSSTTQLSKMNKISEKVDSHGIKHVRLAQSYAGYPVWGGEAILHYKNNNITMNGNIYNGLEVDLKTQPDAAFAAHHEQAASEAAYALYAKKATTKPGTFTTKTEKWVYIDEEEGKGHYVYLVKLKSGIKRANKYLIDAITDKVYLSWSDSEYIDPTPPVPVPQPAPQPNPAPSPNIDDQTTIPLNLDKVRVEGRGGNESYPLFYDDKQPFELHFPYLRMLRDAASGICYLHNDTIKIIKMNQDGFKPASFKCSKPVIEDKADGNVYTESNDEEFIKSERVNGGFSPSNDILYLGEKVADMYYEWLNTPILFDSHAANGRKQMMLSMIVLSSDAQMPNAFWEEPELKMVFGCGDEEFYPFVSPDVVAHELAHGFTEQNSRLIYVGESGGLNESFSDMSSKAFEAYTIGSDEVHWSIGLGIYRNNPEGALRYMMNPSHDIIANHLSPGVGSIDNAESFKKDMDPHYSSGVFNHAFYLFTTKGWSIKKTFDVMAIANMHYWPANASFKEAACGVKSAAKNYSEKWDRAVKDMQIVDEVMKEVGIDTVKCKNI